MEPDVQVQEIAATPQQPAVEPTETVSEDVTTPQVDQREGNRGDLNVALREERQRRQDIESRLNDPTFIYQKARELGLTDEEAQAAVAEQAPIQAPSPNPYAQYKYFSELEKAQEKYPELASTKKYQLMVSALINDGMTPLKAADEVFSDLARAKEEAKAEGITQGKAELTAKERAQTAPTGNAVNSDAAEYEALVARSKSRDPKIQGPAMQELLKRRFAQQ